MFKIEGFINVNKPEGITSADVVREVKKEIKPKKIGYLGTLDPIAKGVLLLGLGRATKLFPFLENLSKVYDATMTLGASTDTQDRLGKVLAEADASDVTEERVKEVMATFTGDIKQIPPMYSAKKVKGERLYDLARQGIEIERKPINARVYELDFIEKKGADVRFVVKISKGGYVRTLCHDMGEKLGVHAFLKDLTRLANGHFRVEDSIELDEIRRDNLDKINASLISFSDALSHIGKAVIIPHAVSRLENGMPVGVSDIIDYQDVEGEPLVRIVKKGGELVSVGEKEGPPLAGFPFSHIKPKRVLT